MNFQVIFLVGPQGSGKGTQGKRLADKLGYLFWGMGSILREMKENLQFAARITQLDRGALLPDEIIQDILKEKLAEVPNNRGIVFDGVPRRVSQAEFLIPLLRTRGIQKMATVFIDLPRQDSLKRLLKRADEEGRADDTPDAIERRFTYFDETMPPLMDYLKKETEYLEVDGRPNADEVEKLVDAALGLG